jgi:DNA polymerase elongation subunit (family B)
MSYIDAIEDGGKVYCWERGKDGLKSHVTPAEYCLFMKSNNSEGEYLNIFGERMKKIRFETSRKREAFADSHADVVCESDVPAVYHYLIDNYAETDSNGPYNVCLFDIEVDFDLKDGHGFPTPQNPFGEINSFSIYDGKLDEYIMIIPEKHKGEVVLKDERDGKRVTTIWSISESDMLRIFADYLEHVDITSAWNGDGYDIPYIMERAIMLFGEKTALTMFTRNGLKARKREFTNEYGQDVWEWRWPGRPHLDMMKLFKNFHQGERKSFSLDNICKEELGEEKISYTGNLGDLYRLDPQKFYEYSLHDSRLMMMLEDKQKIIKLAMFASRDGCSLPKDIFGSVLPIEMSIMKMCREDNIVLPDRQDHEDEDFPGAIVFDTVTGKHDWLISADVVSMYPHVMMMLGLSEETLVGQLRGKYEDYVKVITADDSEGEVSLELYDGSVFEALPSDINMIIKENDYTISAHGTIFNGHEGILAKYVRLGFEKRSKYKKAMKEATDPNDAAMYNIYQTAAKRICNSVYGASSNGAFRLYNIRIAASITTTAQLCVKRMAYTSNNFIEERVYG